MLEVVIVSRISKYIKRADIHTLQNVLSAKHFYILSVGYIHQHQEHEMEVTNIYKPNL